ncbi:MAG: hypothetical protein WA902_11590, partial [Thermosynechococcaceae cyanobacterium]
MTASSLSLHQDKALEIERDIAYGEFDPSHLEKYKVKTASSTPDPIAAVTVTSPTLSDLWKQYSEARTAGKSPATIFIQFFKTSSIHAIPSPNHEEFSTLFLGCTAPRLAAFLKTCAQEIGSGFCGSHF